MSLSYRHSVPTFTKTESTPTSRDNKSSLSGKLSYYQDCSFSNQSSRQIKMPLKLQFQEDNVIEEVCSPQEPSANSAMAIRKELLQTQNFNVQELIKSEQQLLDQYAQKAEQLQNYNEPAKQPGRIARHTRIQASPNVVRNRKFKSAFNFQIQPEVPKEDSDIKLRLAKYVIKLNLSKNLPNIRKSDFLKTFQMQDSLQQLNQFYQQPQNLYQNLAQTSLQQNQLKTFGLIQNTTQLIKVNSSRYMQSNQDIERYAFALGTKQCKLIQSMKLNNNKYPIQSFYTLLRSFPKSLLKLKLVNCQLTHSHVEILMPYLQHQQIQQLNLENNLLRDYGCQTICKGLLSNHHISVLCLNKNNISDMSYVAITNLIKETQYIVELFLNMNKLGPKSGVGIWKAMYKNQSIKVLDLSHNYIASEETAQLIFKAITRPYNELLHLDLSFNKFKQAEAQLIQMGLEKNETIYGFHFEGNQDFIVDPCGFLVDPDRRQQNIQKQIESQLHKPRQFTLLDDNESEPKIRAPVDPVVKFHRNIQIKSTKNNGALADCDACWICQGWQEYKFVWTPYKDGNLHEDPIFIHIDFEGYRPLLMTKGERQFTLWKMCPPNREVQFYFSNPVLGIQTVAKNQFVKELKFHEEIQIQQYLFNKELLIYGGSMKFVNQIFTQKDLQIFKKYVPLFTCKPRQQEPVYDFFKDMGQKKQGWSIETSIFKHYQPDNEILINECFEFDFQSSKIPRTIREADVEDVKELLRKIYPGLFNCYKYYVSPSAINLPCITMNGFMDLLFQLNILQDGLLKNNDIEISYVSTTNKENSYNYTYEKGLVRFQFMEILVRLANDKYIRNNIETSTLNAIQKLIDQDGLHNWIQKFDEQQTWRSTRLWNEDCDKILKHKLPFLRLLFKFTSRLNTKEQYYQYDWAQAKDFRDLCNKCNLVCDHLTDRETYLCYLLSMMTQVDEINQPRHFQMNFYEFIEALCRTAEKLSIIRYQAYSIEERRFQKLHKKIDGLLIYLYILLKDQIKTQLSQESDVSVFDRVMAYKEKTLKQKIEDSFTDEDEELYDPTIELKHLESQLENTNRTQQKRLSMIRTNPKVKPDLQLFTMVRFVQYFTENDS